jgi:hypothetical protein
MPSSRDSDYLRFWTAYFERVRDLYPSWTDGRNPLPHSFITQRSGIPGTNISICFGRGGKLRHELYIDTKDAIENDALFEDLRRRRHTLEAAYGRSLDFQRLPDKRGCRIADHGVGDVRHEERWSEYIRWFIDAGARLRRALRQTGLAG